jgi:hypothetical protein
MNYVGQFADVIYPFISNNISVRRYEIEREYYRSIHGTDPKRENRGHGSVCLTYHLNKGRFEKYYVGKTPYYRLTSKGYEYLWNMKKRKGY